ncbi:hypothetical protein SISNIDRAFT_413701 [Sistotremastrum niveocremeum HHB9708]|uniref:BAH-domain-containing protein n=1 Tax=Sistotremastrum niveocremeum HHB9708 TaxID=1314777 RepID=A0A164SQD1_9AGAM|nr:hypothetical protein SISNIDRAFT_413701 [Sistotremastrum niveocremeum HHB9708]
MAISSEVKAAIETLITELCDLTAPGRKSRKLAEIFMELPDKEDWPDYYEAIPEPRSINGIRESLAKGSYKKAEEVYADLMLVTLNAEYYNEEGSQIYIDAGVLKSWIERNWKQNSLLPAPGNTPPSSPSKKKGAAPAPPAQSLLPPAVYPSVLPPRPSSVETRNLAPPPASLPLTNSVPVQPPSTVPTPTRQPSPDIEGDGPGSPEPTGERAARMEESDAIVRQLERGLPRWEGPGQGGFVTDLPIGMRYEDVIDCIKQYRGPKGKNPADALEDVPQEPVKDASYSLPLSWQIIETRAQQGHYENAAAFDIELTRFFEKARRFYERGSVPYGDVLTCQRLYQQLTSPLPPSMPPQSATYFASLPAGPGVAKPIHAADANSEAGVTTFRIPSKDRIFTEEAQYKGMSYKLGDWVHLINPDDPTKPIVAQIFKTWISDEPSRKGHLGVTVCWYYRPEQTYHPPVRQFWENEVFKTGHFAEHVIEDVIEKISCQFTARHIRGRPRPPYWYPGWPLYVCDSRYNDRERVFVKIKNWNSCVPEEVRKREDWMPTYPFERTVYPTRHSSPFLKGIKGPGGLGDSVERADGEKIEGGGTGRKRLRRPAEKLSSTTAVGQTRGLFAGSYEATASTSNATSSHYPSYNDKPPYPSTSSSHKKTEEDRSVVTAAGGVASLQGTASIQKLPAETAKHFDRDPDTNEVLWFSGPPLDIPHAPPPRHSLKYLHFLAKKRKRKDGPDEATSIKGEGETPAPPPKKLQTYKAMAAAAWASASADEIL